VTADRLVVSVEGRIVNVNDDALFYDISGRLLGGCIHVLGELVGTRFAPVAEYAGRHAEEGILWYMEDFALTGEQLQIVLWQLGEAGWFRHVKGFIFGRPCFYPEEADYTHDEAVLKALARYQVPVITGADIGHRPPWLTVLNGVTGTAEFAGGRFTLRYPENL